MNPEQTPTPDEEAAIERLVDQGVYNYGDATVAIMGLRTVHNQSTYRSFRGNSRIGEGDRDVAIGPGGLAGPAYVNVRPTVLANSDEQLAQRLEDEGYSQPEIAARLRARRDKRR